MSSGHAGDARYERSVTDADGHDEVWILDERLVPSAGGRAIMNQQYAAYQVVPYPKMRRLEALAYRSVQHKPMIHGLLEVDVTRARARLREHKATTGESLSFTAFLAACLAKAWESFNVLHWPWLLLRPAFQVMVWMGKRSPQLWKKYRGTVGMTAIGMFGKGAG